MTTLYGHRLTAEGKLHGATKCRVCNRTAAQVKAAIMAKPIGEDPPRDRQVLVQLDPFSRLPICTECQRNAHNKALAASKPGPARLARRFP